MLHGIGGRSVEDRPIDDCLDSDSATNKLPHGVGYVLVVAPQAIHPTHHQRVSLPEVEQSPPFRTFTEASGEARNTMVSQHQIRFKSDLVGVGSLMIECLIDGTYATIQNSFHARLACPLGCRPRGALSADASLASAVGKAKVFLMPPRLCPCGHDTNTSTSDHRDGDALSSTIMSIIVIQPLMVAICTSSSML
jgi:hypothetical protein